MTTRLISNEKSVPSPLKIRCHGLELSTTQLYFLSAVLCVKPLWKIGQAPCSHTKGVFGSPAPSRVAVARSFERHVPTTASSNLHTIAAMRVASRVAPQCFCLRCRACEYQASNCELQVGVGVVEYGFMLQTRARNPKLRPSADGLQTDTRQSVDTRYIDTSK